MKRLSRFLSVFLVSVLMAGCASVAVQSDFDESARFDRFETFAWIEAENTQDVPGPYREDGLLDKRILRAVTGQLQTLGYTEKGDGTPDFYVVYRVGLEEKTRNSYFDGYPYGYGSYGFGVPYRYRGFGHYGFGHYSYGHYGYGYGSGYRGSYGATTTYTEGTLVIDIIDATTDDLVWRGSAVSPINDMAYDRKDIQRAVEKILKEFPPPYPQMPSSKRREVVSS